MFISFLIEVKLVFKGECYEEALVDFDSVLVLNPMYTNAYLFRGHSKTKMYDYKGAIDDYDSVLVYNKESAEALSLEV